jgi:hypothetical protein
MEFAGVAGVGLSPKFEGFFELSVVGVTSP